MWVYLWACRWARRNPPSVVHAHSTDVFAVTPVLFNVVSLCRGPCTRLDLLEMLGSFSWSVLAGATQDRRRHMLDVQASVALYLNPIVSGHVCVTPCPCFPWETLGIVSGKAMAAQAAVFPYFLLALTETRSREAVVVRSGVAHWCWGYVVGALYQRTLPLLHRTLKGWQYGQCVYVASYTHIHILYHGKGSFWQVGCDYRTLMPKTNQILIVEEANDTRMIFWWILWILLLNVQHI